MTWAFVRTFTVGYIYL